MTRLMERVLAQAAALPEIEQDELAGRWLAELEDDQRWRDSFARSANLLAQLANEARAEHRARLTEDLDPERL